MFLLSTTQSGTDACARLHFASSLSFVSCSYGFLSCRFLLFTSLNNPSHCSRPFIRPLCLISPLLPPLQLHPVGLTASPFLLHPLNPLHSFFSSFLFICVYTLHSPTPLPHFLLLPLCSLADSFAGYSVKTSLEAPIDAQNDMIWLWWWLCLFCGFIVSCDLVKVHIPSSLYSDLWHWLMHQFQAGREPTGPGCSPQV